MKGKWLKVLAALACLTLAAGVAACGGTGGDGSSASSSSSVVENSYSEEISSSEVESSEESSEEFSDEESSENSSEKKEETIGTEGLVYEMSEDGTYATVTDYVGMETQVIIAPVYENVPVTSIGSSAFQSCSKVTEVVIPDGVTIIDTQAFRNCNRLTKITIPDSVTSIGNNAFYGCSSLTEIVIPDSVTSMGDYAFYGCDSLTIYCEVESQPNGWSESWHSSNCPVVWDCNNNDAADDGYIYTVVDDLRYALKDGVATVVAQPSNITVANIPETITYKDTVYSVKSIDEYAFSDCSSLTEIVIPDSVTSIGYAAFSGCGKLQYTVKNGLKYLGNENNPYIYLAGKTTEITSGTIENGCKFIGKSIFRRCYSLTEIVIPDSVTSIGDSAFEGCHGLTSVTIGENSQLTSIGGSAFLSCHSLTKIVIPDSVTSIGGSAFHDCISLTGVYITDIAAWCNISFERSYLANPLYYAQNLYLDGELVTKLTIPDSVTSIDKYTFYNCNSLTEIVIPDSVTSIGQYAFEGCSGLTIYCEVESQPSGWVSGWNENRVLDVYLPVVWDCNNNEVAGNGYVYTVVDGLRYGIKGGVAAVVAQPKYITVANIPETVMYKDTVYSVTSIDKKAFYDFQNLTEVIIPDSVASIGKYAFRYCYSLTEVVIPDSVTSIGEGAFYSSISLTIYCEAKSKPSGWDSDWHSSDCPVVWNCNNNDVADDGYSYTVVDGVRYSLKDGVATVVSQSRSITVANIPESITHKGVTYNVTSIADHAFSNCVGLTGVTFGENSQLMSIGDWVFAFCDSLTEIVIPDGVTSIGNNAFYNCDGLTSVTFGENSQLTSIGEKAFHSHSGNGLTEIVIPDSVTSIGWYAFYGCDSLTIYCEMERSPSGWDGDWNVSDCPVYWYRENEPTTTGNYWHYGENGDIVIW